MDEVSILIEIGKRLFDGIAVFAIIVAAVPAAAKWGMEALKLWEDRQREARARRYLIEDRKDEAERNYASAIERAELGLREFHRHMWENRNVIRTMIRAMDDEDKVPFEVHIQKLGVMPMPWFLTDAEIAKLPIGKQEGLTKLQRMLPNFQREFDQAERIILIRDQAAAKTIMRTLLIKSRVGSRFAKASYQSLTGRRFKPLSLSQRTFSKPIDYYTMR